jgi:tetratricopeptide (TPR) repeat protein
MAPDDTSSEDKSTLVKKLNDTKELISNLKSMGADVEAAELIIDQAEKTIEKGNLDMTQALLDSAENTFSLIKQQYFIQSASILFSSLQRSIVSLEGAGSEVNFIKDLYNKAKEKFDTAQYDEAMDYMKSAEDMVEDLKANLPEELRPSDTEPESELNQDTEPKEQLSFSYDRSQEKMEEVSQVLIRVDKLLQEAVDAGYAVNDAEKLYSLAEDAFDYQDYKKAEQYAVRSEQALEDILGPMHERASKSDSSAPEAEIESEAPKRKLREDIPSGDSFASNSDTLSDMLPKGIIGKASTESSEEDIETAISIEKEATNLLIAADEKLNEAKESGLNLPMAERLLLIGESYFDRGDFETVKDYANKAIKQVEEMISRKGIQEIGGKPITTPDNDVAVESIDEPSESSVPSQIPTTPTKRAESKGKAKSSSKGKGQDRSQAVEKLNSGLNKIKSDISEAMEMGLDLTEAQDMIDQALIEFDNDHFTDAKRLGKNAKSLLKENKKMYIKKKALEMVKYAWKEIAQAEQMGIDISEATVLLQESRNLIKSGKFDKAVKMAIESIQTVKGE